MAEDKRLEQIQEQIIRLANADFSTQGTLSDKGDDLDSVIVGLNLLGEELESYTLQLKESEERLTNTLQQLTNAQHLSHIGSWEWNLADNTIEWTDELYRIYGRDRETFGSSFDNFIACIHPEDRQLVSDVIQQGLKNKEAFSFSHRAVCADGTEKILDCKGDVHLGEDGQLNRMTGTAQDVTELRRAEEKIMQLAAIVESSNDAIIGKTVDGYITSWNRKAETLFGYTETEILGKPSTTLFPDDRVGEEATVLHQVISGGSLIDFETERKKKDGSTFPIAATYSVIKDGTGKILGISTIARDITEKKQAEEKIIQLAAIVESSRDAIISKTVDGYITSWNKQAEILFGYKESEILGQHISILFPPDRLDEETMIQQKITNNEALPNLETMRMRKDGSVFPVAATISAIHDPRGRMIGISNIIRDITEKKQAEAKLQAYTTALEQKNHESEQFAYVASHDLQEPLRTITNFIGIFSDEYKDKLDENAGMYLQFINGASVRMQTLITDLLEYTTIENDRKWVEIDCNALISEILQDMSATINDTGTTVNYGNLPVITGQASRFKSLFQNLISNAIKFRKKEVAPFIEISAEEHSKEWQFRVTDNGIGIDKAYYEKIFKLFQRLHGRKEYEGTGIGLAHCKKIVDLRGGRIWVESEPGAGSSFYFTVPKTYHL